MSAKRERDSLVKVLVHEGGYVNHPKDPGGPTNKGVTQRVYDAFRLRNNLQPQSVKNITNSEIAQIYDKQYWDAVKADDLPDGLDYVVFDGAVNSGPKQSIKWLQRALGALYKGAIDGVIGLGTLAAVAATADIPALIDRICDLRLKFLKALKTWKTFGKGWASRVEGVRQVGKAWATGAATMPAVSFYSGGQAKASIESAKTAPSVAAADASIGGGVGAGGIAGTLQSLQDQLTPYSIAGDWIVKVVVVLAIAGALMTAGGIAYRWYANRKAAKLAEALG